MDHFSNPRNVGEVPDADGVGDFGSPVCGDAMHITIKVVDDTLADVKFKTFGCGAAVASSSMITEMVMGKTLAEAAAVTNRAVAEALGGLPPQKMHCSILAADALHLAIADYLTRAGRGDEVATIVGPLPQDDAHEHDVEADGHELDVEAEENEHDAEASDD
jgi:nitrogen fixation NifU-like protein